MARLTKPFQAALAALALLAGCGQVFSPLGGADPVATANSNGALLTNFEGGGVFKFLNPPFTEANPINSSMKFVFSETGSPTAHYWDLSGSAVADIPGGSTLVGGSPTRGLRIWGVIGADGPPYWPYAQVGFPLSTVGIDLISMAPTGKISFSVKAKMGAAYASSYRIVVTDRTISDYGWYGYTFTPPNSNWNNYTVHFPPTTQTAKLAQPTWPTQIPFTTTGRNVTTIYFSVLAAGTRKEYDVVLDDFWLR